MITSQEREVYADRALFPLPSLMFLDLKLPYLSGFEVLAWLRAQPAFKESPVIILTSSPEARDQKRALELGAKAYMIKPPTEETLHKIARGDSGLASSSRIRLEGRPINWCRAS